MARAVEFDEYNRVALDTGILVVYQYNFEYAMDLLKAHIPYYSVITMDTEFTISQRAKPSITASNDPEGRYEIMRQQVITSKLLQVGICLMDNSGHHPEGVHTYQFNLHYDEGTMPETMSNNSKNFLTHKAALDFESMKTAGIPADVFMRGFKTANLFGNTNLTFVTYHGALDYMFLIFMLCGINDDTPDSLPTRGDFLRAVNRFFYRTYDVEILLQFDSVLSRTSVSLSKGASALGVEVEGKISHHSGYDSYQAAAMFRELRLKEVMEKIAFDEHVSEMKEIGNSRSPADPPKFMYIPGTPGIKDPMLSKPWSSDDAQRAVAINSLPR